MSDGSRRRGSIGRSRGAVVVVSVVLLAVVAAVSAIVAWQLLERGVDRDINAALAQETRNLERFAADADPASGEGFGTDAERIFNAYMTYSPPDRHEAYVAFVDGQPVAHAPSDPPYRLHEDDAIVRRWATVGQTDRGRVTTPEGDVEYVAVPVRVGDDVRGVFVAAVFRDLAAADTRDVLWAALAVGAVMVVVGAVAVAYAGRGIGASPLPVSDRQRVFSDRAEVRALAGTFDDMLRQLEAALERREQAEEAGDEEEVEHAQAAVIGGLDIAARTAEDLLTLEQAQHPGFLTRQMLDADALVDEVIGEGAALADRRWHLDAMGGGSVFADRRRLLQALMHLTLNAIQHTDASDEIGVGAIVEHGEVRFWVRDTGLGIPVDDQDHMLKRFYHGERRAASQGLGLGLAVVDAIAKAHAGRVEIVSGPGAGTIASIVLPPQGQS